MGANEVIQSNNHAMEGLIYIVLLSIIGTSLALVIFNQILSMSSPLFASSVTYFIPIVALLLGIVFGESIEAFQIFGMFVVLLGVYTINKKATLK